MGKYKHKFICDMAETYHVFDWRALPLSLAATLAGGLREDSRCAMALKGQRVSGDTILQAASLDYLALLWWAKTEDGAKGRNRPASVLSMFLNDQAKEPDAVTFDSVEAYEAARAQLVGGA